MKKILFLISILIFISCKNEKVEKSPDSIESKELQALNEIIKRDFPLKNLSRVEFLSYKNRMDWDKKATTKEENKYSKDLVKDSKLNFDSTMIKERVVLNSLLQSELLNLTVQDTCKIEEFVSDCYMPRHMILFRDSKNRIIGYKELCFSCKGFRESKNLKDYNGFCFSQMNDLFKKAGIIYFDDDYE